MTKAGLASRPSTFRDIFLVEFFVVQILLNKYKMFLPKPGDKIESSGRPTMFM